MENFKFFKSTPAERRKYNTYMLITPVGNCSMKHHPMDALYKTDLPYNPTRHHQNYFHTQLKQRFLPYHYLVYKERENWYVQVGAPLFLESPLVNEGIESGYLPMTFKNTVVVAVQGEFDVVTPDEKLYRAIASLCVAPFLWYNKGNLLDRVFWFDQIFNHEAYEHDLEIYGLDNKYPFQVKRAPLINDFLFTLHCRKYQ